ncbi:GTP-binding protein At3g49725, chloroplastic isoform X3 [Brachypodium distachyon]|uniref:GTP-binding protein At3g49725, chloroplastic isoform X3 n=1 Tax=Brachypodium distachyon TaxID=15368 RepID=UPI00071D8D84|nr:GTP-binding protein At3g49725, chloroplastic isoform X3 [Brachypodium distachyon]|eukprot:XP_014752415.1 GTP-binding protein At3g49725, chloroplastic isoform X3 [Brachypodium distachyon]
MFRAAISRLGAHLHRHPSPASPPVRALSTGRGKRSSPTAAPPEPEDEGLMRGLFVLSRDPEHPPRLLVVQPRLRPSTLLDSKLAEALNLASSLQEARDGFDRADESAAKDGPPHLVVQNPASRGRNHADTYFGPGTVDNIKCYLRALDAEEELDAVFVNTLLSGIQQRNLEVAWVKPVLDRVGLIIEIFNAHAETKEAKLQSELAALMYMKTRLVRVRGPGGRLTFGTSGEAEVVSARGRGSGGRGFMSGAGETELQLQRRRIQDRRISLLTQIEDVRRTRAIQRSSRKRHGGSFGQELVTIAVVGYTNAGKSTLVSALSEADLYSDDRLFATVDPRLRSVILPSGRKALLSDTVGFISDLPVQLVEAFHATLEEVAEADMLVHVLDSSAPNLDEHRSTVLQVLQQIGVSEDKINNMIEVWNKIDLVDNNALTDGIEDEIFLTEGEEEEDLFSEDDVPSEQSSFDSLDDTVDSESLSEENSENGDDKMASDKSFDEPIDMKAMNSELLTTECFREPNGPKAVTTSGCTLTQSVSTCHVKTSAVTGTGLQELLQLIDTKLNEQQQTVVQRSYGPFDRKWRPCSLDGKKAAEHPYFSRDSRRASVFTCSQYDIKTSM